MPVAEPARLALYNRLGEVLGPEYADTLMLSLQSSGEIVTKADLRSELAEMRADIREIHLAIHRQNRLIIAAMTALTGIFALIVGLIT